MEKKARQRFTLGGLSRSCAPIIGIHWFANPAKPSDWLPSP
jgi:hypothetical protein